MAENIHWCAGCGRQMGSSQGGVFCFGCDNYHKVVLPNICNEARQKNIGIIDAMAERWRQSAQ